MVSTGGHANAERKTVLITFGRSFMALELARLMSAAGHRVILSDSMRFPVGRFSDSVDKFVKTPPPRYQPREFVAEIIRTAVAEQVDLIIPMHEETDVLAAMRDLFPSWCNLFLSNFMVERNLHSKVEFQRVLQSFDIPVFKFHVLTNQEEADALVLDYDAALKPAFSRGSQRVRKVRAGEHIGPLEFDPDNPWLVQEWGKGKAYCTYSICHEGEIKAHTVYPVEYAIDGSSCLVFTAVENPGIDAWVAKFVKDVKFTGQIGFDIIETPDNELRAIECNPRSTSGLMLFDESDRVDRAFFGIPTDDIITPRVGTKKMIGPGMLMYGWKQSSYPNNSLRRWWQEVRSADDVIVRRGDLGPTFGEPLAYASILSAAAKYHVNLAEAYLHDHSWEGQPIQ